MSEEIPVGNPTEIKENEKQEPIKDALISNEEIKKIGEENTNKKEKERYFGIDVIRVLACYLVIQTHAAEFYYIDNGQVRAGKNNIFPGIYSSFARCCVPLFVMISGYLLLPMKTDIKTFLKRRFTRVAFPFIFFCIVYDIYFYLRGRIKVKDMLLNIPKIFLNYGVDVGHLWFMYMIMGVYLFIPIISPFIEKATFSHYIYYFIFWGISMNIMYIHLKVKNIWGECPWNTTPTFQSFTGDFGYAILGCFVKVHLPKYNLYILGVIIYFIGCGITMLGYFLKRRSWKEHIHDLPASEIEVTWNFTSINVGMSTLGLFLILRKRQCQNYYVKKIFNDIAMKSYGMYLIHILFLDLFYYLFNGEKQSASWCIFAMAIPTFIVSYGAIKAISYIPYSQYIIG